VSLLRYLADVGQAADNLRAQKTRTLLTALGIVFGVGSVIGMLAIGAGARQESLRFIEQLGVRNLLVESRPATSQAELQQRRRTSPGLTDRDVRILKTNIEDLDQISARRTMHPSRVLPKPAHDVPELYGVNATYAPIHSLQPVEGKFFDANDDEASAAVCVLGERAKVELLGYEPAVGKFVKVNDTWLEVVGVLAEQISSGQQTSASAIQDNNNIVYIPLNTFQYRFWDVSTFMKDDLDGIDLRLKSEARSVEVAKIDPEWHASQRSGFQCDDSGGPSRAAAADADDLHVRDGGDRGDLAAGGRHRHHEHRAGNRDGAHERDRNSPRDRRAPQ
jgi:putative ABC transport system permease protein